MAWERTKCSPALHPDVRISVLLFISSLLSFLASYPATTEQSTLKYAESAPDNDAHSGTNPRRILNLPIESDGPGMRKKVCSR
ncbi:hypothetical protein EDD18DRAFT_1125030 [Armillaria luteobubalina]|uniref:Uncharacterized protein n=1 Tax=Armillaria luteobubalina TaxID=153913 RepID=A0AA39V5Q0_9AGAR|nr:hypothetical protein EDD18DRAFT_1125030 [Armillaria luteobubalina]